MFEFKQLVHVTAVITISVWINEAKIRLDWDATTVLLDAIRSSRIRSYIVEVADLELFI